MSRLPPFLSHFLSDLSSLTFRCSLFTFFHRFLKQKTHPSPLQATDLTRPPPTSFTAANKSFPWQLYSWVPPNKNTTLGALCDFPAAVMTAKIAGTSLPAKAVLNASLPAALVAAATAPLALRVANRSLTTLTLAWRPPKAAVALDVAGATYGALCVALGAPCDGVRRGPWARRRRRLRARRQRRSPLCRPRPPSRATRTPTCPSSKRAPSKSGPAPWR